MLKHALRRPLPFLSLILLISAQKAADFVPLFADEGAPKGWSVRAWDDVKKDGPEGAKWLVKDGVLNGSEAVGSKIKVVLNDEVVQDVDLSEHDKKVERHDGSAAPALKDRPRRGHIGFQELSRGGGHVEIRNAKIKVLD